MIYSYVNDKNKLLLDVMVQFVVHNKVSHVFKSKILSHNQHKFTVLLFMLIKPCMPTEKVA